MLVDRRRTIFEGLDAEHGSVQLRTPEVRLVWFDQRNVTTDFGLLHQALPFTHRFRRSGLTVVFEGEGRFEEDGRRTYFGAGSLVASSLARGGTEAYTGDRSSYLIVEWAPGHAGDAHVGPYSTGRLSPRELARLAGLRDGLTEANAPAAAAEVFAVLRAAGLPVGRLEPAALGEEDPAEQELLVVVSDHLARLDRFPTIEEVAARLGWTPRTVHRRLATVTDRYEVSFQHWREGVHQARLTHALRLLSVRGATTELVARACGFRSPTALCHAFSDAGLPSPGRVAEAARHEVLARWSDIADAMARRVAPPPSFRAA